MIKTDIKNGLQLIVITMGFYSWYQLLYGFNIYVFAIASVFGFLLLLGTIDQCLHLGRKKKERERLSWKPPHIKPTKSGPKELKIGNEIIIRHFDISSGYYDNTYNFDYWREMS